MLNYERKKEIDKIKNRCLDIALFPIRCICTPLYKLYEKYKKNKRYSYNTILKLVKFAIDYHLNYDEIIYVVFSDYVDGEVSDHSGFGYWSLCNISWNYEKIRNKLSHIYQYQKDEYIKAVKELCGNPMTEEEKKAEFTRECMGRKFFSMAYYKLQNKEVCKIEK